MAIKLMGKKRGMMQLFDENGNIVVCTVIQIEPNVVTQVKTKESDGYNAIQLGYETITVNDPRTMETRVTKPLRGHFQKAGVTPRRHLKESKLTDSDDINSYSVGKEISVNIFTKDSYIDATAVSKGKGYQGVIKRHHFAGGPAAHGSGFHRHAGSTGMRSTPGRGLPGGKKAGQMGNTQVTMQNLKVIMVKEDENVLIVKGQVPGSRNGLVYVSAAKKKS